MMKHLFYSIFFCGICSFSSHSAPLQTGIAPADFEAKSPAEIVADTESADVLALTPWDLLNGMSTDIAVEDIVDEVENPEDPFGALREGLVDYAKNYLGCRYVHGGKGPSVFDCSGFTSFVYRKFGYSLSPASRMQGTQGNRVGSVKDAEVGDLMFFSGRAGGRTVGHVGMVVEVNKEAGTLKFIHASVKRGVTIQSFPDGAYYSKHFLHVQRVLD